MNGHMQAQDGPLTVPYVSHLQQPVQTSTDSSNQQRAGHVRYAPNGYVQGSSSGDGSEMLSTMLAAASPEIQKQILGERLYPLVNQLKPDLAAKITGMLLEMDNLEVLLLLESPESLASKVEEAVHVLELSNQTKVSSQEGLHPNLLSAQVAVN